MTTTTNTCTFTQGSNSVSILLTGDNCVKYRFDKLLFILPVPKQSTPFAWIVDLKRLQETVTITGFIEDEVGDTMWQKRTRLRTMLQSGSSIFITWDSNDTSQPYEGQINTCEINEHAYGLGNSEDTKSMSVTIQFTLGRLKG